MTDSIFRGYTLYSGSGGNAVYLSDGESAILIDCGKSARALCSALCEIGASIDEVAAIFITHEHTDHVSALEVLSKKRAIPIHITEPSAAALARKNCPAACRAFSVHPPKFTVRVGTMTVSSFLTPHDAQMSVGYVVSSEKTTERVAVATDMGFITNEIADELIGCQYVILESNHDMEMLLTGPYPLALKERIRSRRGHLSNEQCASLLPALARGGMRTLLLAHLSEENNAPELALRCAEETLAGTAVAVSVASPLHPTKLI